MDGSFMWDGVFNAGEMQNQSASSATGPLTVAVIGNGGDGGLTVDLLRHGFSVVPSTTVPNDPAWINERRVDTLVALPGCDRAELQSLFTILNAAGNPARLITIGSKLSIDAPWCVNVPDSADTRGLVMTIATVAAASRRARIEGTSGASELVTRSGTTPSSKRSIIDGFDDIDETLESACVLADKLREELDVEMLLRKTLEYTIGAIGAVNAAIYLPRPSGDLALGAFVSASLPGGESETVLDDLAAAVADRASARETSALFTSDDQLDSVFDAGAYWLEQSDVIVTPCRDRERELAVILIFRDRANGGLDSSAVDELESVAAALTGQLARAVRVHNRLCDEDGWFGFNVDEPGDGLF